MKKLFVPLLLALMMPAAFSCSGLKNFSGYHLTEKDAADALRQLLQIGATTADFKSTFSKETIISTVFPPPVSNVLQTVQQLGLTSEIDRFTTTLSTAATQTAEKSVPIFLNGVSKIKFRDAMHIVKTGGTAATSYLRSTVGDSLRSAVNPVMQAALEEYKLNEQWEKIIKPVKSVTGNKLNIELSNLMAGVVTEMMFRKLEEKEQQIRNEASARTTNLLQKVFSKNWN